MANSLSSVFLLNTASNFTNNLQSIPWNVKFQEHQDQEARVEYAALFEMGGAIITLFGLLIFALLTESLFFKDILFYGIIVGSLVGVLINIVRK